MIGSIWNKWDLHIHSPLTHENNQFAGCSLESFADQIIANELSLVGLTNYFFFEKDEIELVKEALGKSGSDTVILPNLEFRINQQNKDGEWINLHCIFSENLSTEQINNILSSLPILNTSTGNKNIYCSRDSFAVSGVTTSEAVVDLNTLLQHLQNNFIFGTDFLVAACPNGYGGFRPDVVEGRSRAIAIEIDKSCQIILGRPQDREFFLDKSRYPDANEKPVIFSSDAHKLQEIGSGYSWVKAKPTFEGLRQAVIEPDLRVQQTDTFIEKTYIKPKFSSVEIGGKIFPDQKIKFTPQTIPLNPNLVTIIGGRGTGKSLFLDAMFSRFNHQSTHSNARDVEVENLIVLLNQGDGTILTFSAEENTYSYLHVSQGDIQSFSKNPSDLSNEIKRMLGIKNEQLDPVVGTEMTDLIGRYRSFVEYWESTDVQGNRINTQDYQNGIIARNTQLISTLTNPQNRLLIEKYQENSTQINEKSNYIGAARNIKSQIERGVFELNQSIEILNQNANASEKSPVIDEGPIVSPITSNIAKSEKEIAELNGSNEQIADQFRQQGINQDISSLLSKVSEYQQAIDQARSKLDEINQKTGQYHQYVVRRGELSLSYQIYLDSQKESINQAYKTLIESKAHWNQEQNELVKEMLSDILIEGEVVFNVDEFYSGLECCVNRGKFRGTAEKSTLDRLKETFRVTTIEGFFKLVSGENMIACEGGVFTIEEFFWKSEYFNQGGRFELLNYLYSPESIKKYLQVNASFEYKGKTVDKLSVGQRGTFYVCLKLATDPFGSPFVFDQPEDDLDNEFIMNQLVPLFRKIKKYRQVIIVTHNANLVVNTDAEQVIVAKNEGEVISYSSGAVEDGNVKDNQGIRASICNILEGGSYAFEKRERKYGIKQFARFI